ncbi:ankyrin repeat-containing domain protein [Aspergillus tetrazonus]
MHYNARLISKEMQAIARQNSYKVLEAFLQQQYKAARESEYTPPPEDLLLAATDCCADQVAAYCLEHGQKATQEMMTSVVVHNSFAMYCLMVKHKAVRINYVVPWYGDILGTMASDNKIDWVRFCLEHGADLNTSLVKEHLSALACAVHTGNIELVDLLLAHGARLKGSNAIVRVAINEDLEMVEYLLSRGADINKIGIKGPSGAEAYSDMESPLHQAAVEGYTEMALFLIEAGADVYLKDLLGRTAEDLALEKGHMETLDALRQKKIKDDIQFYVKSLLGSRKSNNTGLNT